MNKKEQDIRFITEALILADKGIFSVSPNPAVGAIVVKKGKIIGKGFHSSPGSQHAEQIALNKAGKDSIGATLYVNLEPCCHYGKTPPCLDLIIEKKIKRVVISQKDPNPLVNGKSIKMLKKSGIDVELGVLKEEAMRLNKSFNHFFLKKTPYITAKIGMSLDGKIADHNWKSKWITSKKSRLDVQSLRAQSCAILTGIGTISADDPMLNVRNINVPRQPFIFVLDSKLRIKLDAKILSNPNLFLITAQKKDSTKYKKLKKLGINLKSIPNSFNKVHLHKLMKLFNKMKFNEVLVESGMNLNSALYSEGLIDEFVIYYAPKILGDAGRGMLYVQDALNMSDIPSNKIISYKKIGPDLKINFLTSYH